MNVAQTQKKIAPESDRPSGKTAAIALSVAFVLCLAVAANFGRAPTSRPFGAICKAISSPVYVAARVECVVISAPTGQ